MIEDDPSLGDAVLRSLRQLPANVFVAHDVDSALVLLRQHRPRLVLLDLDFRGTHGLDLLEHIVKFDSGIEVILTSGDYVPSVAILAIQRGAADYLRKPISVPDLRSRVARSIEAAQRYKHTRELDAELLSSFRFHGMVGRSPRLLDLFNKVARVAPHFRTILISGTSGTGKELFARSLHALSPTGNGPFIVLNCAALPEALADTEMFGFIKGAFTGAMRDTAGLFEQADNGTVFLDEIGEMSLAMQAKLLRVLQTHEIQRVGSSKPRSLNIRVIAATNRDLPSAVANRTFRDDLYYRLSSVHLQLPPLVERMEDLPLLQRHFIEKFSKQYAKDIRGLSRRAQNLLAQHSWPGNVRELENLIAHACMMCEGQVVDVAHFPPSFKLQPVTRALLPLVSLKDAQKKYVQEVLDAVEGNKARAADILGISRTTLYNILAGDKAEETG
ncbi:MAG TPA: sigma-54 dependent transcriptional regulator [Terriglobales bacterium]|nr:sigma-54 dependent transcriptional regulator [Terriglobales bacterium]